MNHIRITILLVMLTMVFAGIPAFAQTDFSGEWNPLFHEDDPIVDRGLISATMPDIPSTPRRA